MTRTVKRRECLPTNFDMVAMSNKSVRSSWWSELATGACRRRGHLFSNSIVVEMVHKESGFWESLEYFVEAASMIQMVMCSEHRSYTEIMLSELFQ